MKILWNKDKRYNSVLYEKKYNWKNYETQEELMENNHKIYIFPKKLKYFVER